MRISVFKKPLKRDRLVLWIDIGRRFVEHDDRRILQDGALDGDALTLAARYMTAARADARVITMRKPQNEVFASRSSRGALDLLVGGLRPAHTNVLTNAVVEEIGVLCNEGNEIVELRERNIRTLPAADLQAARIYIPIAGN